MFPGLQDLHSLNFPGEPETAESWRELAKILDSFARKARRAAQDLSTVPNSLGVREDIRRFEELEPICSTDLKLGQSDQTEARSIQKKAKKGCKEFQITNYNMRYTALEIMYIGWKYMGSTFQSVDDKTVEGALMRALKRTRLVAEDATLEGLQFSRSGRTDRGVSAASQIVALRLRSNARLGCEVLPPERECDYPTTLNRALPADIRVLGWTDVPPDFSARFSAKYREYEYFVAASSDLDLSAMRAAASFLLGRHDFRNFCKPDAEHVNHFVRDILEFRIEFMDQLSVEGMAILRLHVRGSAFLWHQVRCMVAVLLLVAKRLEDPEVVKQLLDVESFGDKPQYNIADECTGPKSRPSRIEDCCKALQEPLLFFSCAYACLKPRRTAASLLATRQVLAEACEQHLQRLALLTVLSERLQRLIGEADKDELQQTPGQQPRYIKLARRARELSLEAKFAKFGRTLGKPTPSQARSHSSHSPALPNA